MRQIQYRYLDPLDEVWIDAADKIGFTIERSDQSFAHYDGNNTIFIGTTESLDPDDCLAQMIFHELCHSLVEGAASFRKIDWGLENEIYDNSDREHACLRTQAVLSERYGLRQVLSPTTEHRKFYDELGDNSLENINEPSVRLATLAISRSAAMPWHPHLENALDITAKIAQVVKDHGAMSNKNSLLQKVGPRPSHSTGLPGAIANSCGQCAWNKENFCLHAQRNIKTEEQACERFQSEIDCQNCGACCGRAYHVIAALPSEHAVKKHPQLFTKRDGMFELKRHNGSCVALSGSIDKGHSQKCDIYEDRPSCCREFKKGSQHCLTARRRVGLSL